MYVMPYLLDIDHVIPILYILSVYICICIFGYKDYTDRGKDPEPPEKWQPIGYYCGRFVYEQKFANGRTAWQFKDE
jgi:hypothetical protein